MLYHRTIPCCGGGRGRLRFLSPINSRIKYCSGFPESPSSACKPEHSLPLMFSADFLTWWILDSLIGMSNSRSFGMKKFRFDAEYFFLGIDGMECDSEYFFRFLFIWFWGTGDYFFCKETRTTACKFQSLSRKCAVRVICTWL